jgi:hypothetical protein
MGVSEATGVFAVDVFAIDERAKGFNEKYGFISLDDQPQHLYLPMRTVEALFADV